MAVAYDAVSKSHAGSGPSAASVSEASFSWTHTPVGTPALVVVHVLNGGADAQDESAVTYGGVAMTQNATITASDTTTEPQRVTTWELKVGIPTGAQTVEVTRTNNTDPMTASCMTVTSATGAAAILNSSLVKLEDDGTVAEQNVTDGSPGTNSLRVAFCGSGANAVISVGSNTTLAVDHDYGVRTWTLGYETTAGQGSRPVGCSYGTTDDRAMVHYAITEQPAAYLLTAAVASFALTGVAAAITAQRTLIAGVCALALTGVAAGLTYTPVGGGYTLTADAAAYTLTGTAAPIVDDRRLPTALGSYTLGRVSAHLAYSGATALSGSTFSFEHFEGSSVPSPWTASSTGSSTVTVADSRLQFHFAAASEHAFVYRAFDVSVDQIILVCGSGAAGGTTSPFPDVNIMRFAGGTPYADTGANNNTRSVVSITNYGTADNIRMVHYDTGGVNLKWRFSDNTWQSGGTTTSAAFNTPRADYRIMGIQWDATNSRVRLCGLHGAAGSTENPDYGPNIIGLTDWVAFSAIQHIDSQTTDFFLTIGQINNAQFVSPDTCSVEWVGETYGTAYHWLANGKASVGSAYNITAHTGYDPRVSYSLLPAVRGAIAIDKGSAGQWDDTDTQWGGAILAQDGKIVAPYIGDAGGAVTQIGIATATSIDGTFTKDVGNPIIALGPGGSTYEVRLQSAILVEDWSESDSAKRYKLFSKGTDASAVNRIIVFYAATYNGTYTYDGVVLEDDGTETGVSYRGQPIWYDGYWYLFYNADIAGSNQVRWARSTTLRAGTFTKGNTTITSTTTGYEDEVSAVSSDGLTVTVADTTSAVQDMLLVCTQTSSADTYGKTRIRKVVSSTQLELYHSVPGLASGTVLRSHNFGNHNALQQVLNIEGTWYWVCTQFKVFTTHGSFGTHYESNGLMVGGATPFDAFEVDWTKTPMAPFGLDAWNTTVSQENLRVVWTPLRFYTLTADVGAYTLAGPATGLTAQRTLAAAPGALALTGVAAGLTYAPVGGYTLTATASSITVSGIAAGLTADRTVGASSSTFALTGVATTLTYAPVGSYTLTADAGTFTCSAPATGITAQRTLAADVGACTLAGVAATLTYAPAGAYTLTADAASFTLAAPATGLTAQRSLAAAPGALALTGVAAGLTYSPVGAYTLTADPGTFALSASATGITAQRTLSVGAGAVILAGTATAFALERQISTAVGTFALSGASTTTLTYSGQYRGEIRLTAARGPSLALYAEAGAALRVIPAPVPYADEGASLRVTPATDP